MDSMRPRLPFAVKRQKWICATHIHTRVRARTGTQIDEANSKLKKEAEKRREAEREAEEHKEVAEEMAMELDNMS